MLQGASWQRCRVHFVRNALAYVPRSAVQMVAATIRTVFVQPDTAGAREQWRRVVETFRGSLPPLGRWTRIWSNNPLERLIKEVKRRTDVIGIFPNTAAVTRLVGAVLAEQHEEWQITRRYLSMEFLTKLIGEVEAESVPALVAVG